MATDRELLEQVNRLLRPYGCRATEMGPQSVGVQGDSRVHLPSIYVRFRDGMTMEEIAQVSTRITNEVKGISRVLMEIDAVAMP